MKRFSIKKKDNVLEDSGQMFIYEINLFRKAGDTFNTIFNLDLQC